MKINICRSQLKFFLLSFSFMVLFSFKSFADNAGNYSLLFIGKGDFKNEQFMEYTGVFTTSSGYVVFVNAGDQDKIFEFIKLHNEVLLVSRVEKSFINGDKNVFTDLKIVINSSTKDDPFDNYTLGVRNEGDSLVIESSYPVFIIPVIESLRQIQVFRESRNEENKE